MTGTYAPLPDWTGWDNNGDIVPGGQLFTYIAGTSTKLDTYTDVDLTTPNTNPIVLDAAGRATIFLAPFSYKFVLAPSNDTDPPASAYWTRDNVQAVPTTNQDLDIPGTAGEDLDTSEVVYLSAGSGGQTAGRWYLADADDDYSSTTAKALGFAVGPIAAGESGSIRIQGRITNLSGLSAGTTYYISATAGALTSSAPANARSVLVADSTTSGVLSFWLSVQDASATTAGIVNLTTQTLGAGTKTLAGLVVNTPPTFKPGASADADATSNGRITTNTTPVGNVTTGEDDLMTYTVKANVLSADGKALRVRAWGSYANNGNTKTLKAYFGATGLTLDSSVAANVSWVAEVEVIRTGATAQILRGSLGTAGVSWDVPTPVTPAETLSGAVVFKFTGEGTATNDVVQSGMIIEVVG